MTEKLHTQIIESVLSGKSKDTVDLIKESLQKKAVEHIILQKSIVREEFLTEQDVLAKLGEVVKRKQRSSVKFQDGSSIVVDAFTAQALLKTYEALKQPQAKEKFVRMINKNKIEFMKVTNFALKNTKVGISESYLFQGEQPDVTLQVPKKEDVDKVKKLARAVAKKYSGDASVRSAGRSGDTDVGVILRIGRLPEKLKAVRELRDSLKKEKLLD